MRSVSGVGMKASHKTQRCSLVVLQRDANLGDSGQEICNKKCASLITRALCCVLVLFLGDRELMVQCILYYTLRDRLVGLNKMPVVSIPITS